jgi:hypothetical protein
MMTRLHRRMANPAGRIMLVLPLLSIALAGRAPIAVRISPADPGALQGRIMEAYRAAARKVTISPGIYRIRTGGGGTPLALRDMSDFEIDARGAVFVFTEPSKGAIRFDNCRRVTLRGVSIRFDPLPFTQGVIEAIAPDGMWYDLQVDKGYPDLGDASGFPALPGGDVFDRKTSWWKAGAAGLTPTLIERVGLGRYRLHWQHPAGPGTWPTEVGDKMVFRGRLWGPAVLLSACAQMSLTGITITSSPSVGIVERGGLGGNQYSHITIKRGPSPEGASADPLVSVIADGFHSSGMRRGPVIENCYFEGMMDDGVAVHGSYSLVVGVHGAELVIANNHFEPGDPLRLYDTGNLPVAEAKVLSVTSDDSYRPPRDSLRKTVADIARGPYFRLTLDHAVPAEFDCVVANGNALGSGYRVRNNTIRHHRARGVLLKADDGLVENNTIEGSTIGGIIITPEFEWAEADYSRNIIIRNNTIRYVGYFGYQMGAISVGAWDSDHNHAVAGAGHQNIVIEGNTISDINGVNLAITSAQNVLVQDNRFVRSHLREPWRLPRAWDMNPNAVIWLTECWNIRFKGNTVSNPGPFAKLLVDMTASAHVSGAEGGVKLTSTLK